MTLHKFTNSLSRDKKFRLAIELSKKALPIWDNFAKKGELSYRDSVVGLEHTVDKNFLKDAIEAAEQKLNQDKSLAGMEDKAIIINKQFIEPIVALQDSDWDLPDEALKTFYAVYNLIEAINEKEETVFSDSTIFVSINQSVDALDSTRTLSTNEINNILNKYNS